MRGPVSSRSRRLPLTQVGLGPREFADWVGLHSVGGFHLGGREEKRAEYSTAEYWQVMGVNPTLTPGTYRASLLTATSPPHPLGPPSPCPPAPLSQTRLTATSSHKWSAQTANM